jgi:hypothetical protein
MEILRTIVDDLVLDLLFMKEEDNEACNGIYL